MKTLILMRHAKAAAHEPELADYDRPLAPRGQASAQALGDWLRDQDLVPDLALVSAAKRTMETWEALALADVTPVKSLGELYDGVPSTYLGQLAKQDRDCVLMIGHNPTIASLIDHGMGDEDMPVDLAAVPTGATVAITYDTDDWDDAIKKSGTLKSWVIPRSLVPDA